MPEPEWDRAEVERGLLLLALQADAAKPQAVGWVKRRVEQLEFLDTTAVRWRVSIDFVVPGRAPKINYGFGEFRLVPVTVLPKDDLVAFDLRDEQGAAMWLPTSEETSGRLAPALVVVARHVLRKADHLDELPSLPSTLARDLEQIVAKAPKQHREAYKPFAVAAARIEAESCKDELRKASRRLGAVRFWDFCGKWDASRNWARAQDALADALQAMRAAHQLPGTVDELAGEVAYKLMSNRAFRSQLEELAQNFVVHVAVSSKPGVRRIVKLTSERSVSFWSRRGLWHRLWQTLGWRCWPLEVEMGGRGGSHHLEVATPAGVDVVRVRAVRTGQRTRAEVPLTFPGFSPHVPVWVPGKPPPRYRATIFVRVSRSGWLGASLLVAVVIALVMVLGSLNLRVLFGASAGALPGDAGTAATLLLALLGVIAIWLVRPGEHPLATRLLWLVRLLIFVDVADVLVGTGDLVLHRTTHHLPTVLWSSLAWIASAVAVMMVLSWLMPRRLPEHWGTRARLGMLTVVRGK